MEATKTIRGGPGRWLRRVGTVMVTSALISMMIAGTAITASPWKVDIVTAVRSGSTVTMAGTAYSPAGQQSGNWLQIDWNDGTIEDLPAFVGSGPWAWGPVSHTYADFGTYTITATLLHASPRGNDRNAQDTEVVVIPDPNGDDEEDAEVDVQIALGDCVTDGTTSTTPVTATFLGEGDATVVVRDADDQLVTTFTSTGSEQLTPGAYTYTVTAGEGSVLSQTSDTSGSLTVLDCTPEVGSQGSVAVTLGTCDFVAGASQTPVTFTIAPDGAATITLSDGGDYLRTITASEQVVLAPADYAWTALPAEGFTLIGPTSGSFTAGTCTPIVLGGGPQTPGGSADGSTAGGGGTNTLPRNLAKTGPALPAMGALGMLLMAGGILANVADRRRKTRYQIH